VDAGAVLCGELFVGAVVETGRWPVVDGELLGGVA
jgi:hypothetical protein